MHLYIVSRGDDAQIQLEHVGAAAEPASKILGGAVALIATPCLLWLLAPVIMCLAALSVLLLPISLPIVAPMLLFRHRVSRYTGLTGPRLVIDLPRRT